MMNEEEAFQRLTNPDPNEISDEEFETYWSRVRAVPGLEDRLLRGEPEALQEYFELRPDVKIASVEVVNRTPAKQVL